MRKYLMLTMALAGLIAVSVAGIASAGNKPQTVVAGNLEFTFNGGFSPSKLPKNKLAPIALNASGKIATLNGEHPPALKEAIVETDKNGAVTTVGYPKCTSGKLQSQDTKHAEAICKKAIIGKGTTNVEVKFPEQNPIPVSSKLLVFNGGTKGGVTTFFIHAYITVPTPAAIVTTVTIKKIHHGRYGLLSVASIPKIAGGSGSVTSFNLTINKKYTYKGKKMSVLSAKCPDGKLQAHATAVFADGTKAATTITRTCTGT
ncbi:MAG: hypothetical protein ACTHK3_04030 [Solirubrobacterales bacterium]